MVSSWARATSSTRGILHVHRARPGHAVCPVVFPLPNGNAMVLMRPVAHPDGSLTLISAGRAFGSPGFYFAVHAAGGAVWARYVRALRESIHVYASDGAIRADHVLSRGGLTFLRLHYRLRKRIGEADSAA